MDGRKRRRVVDEDEGYFSRSEGSTSATSDRGGDTLPTPALSSVSLSGLVVSRELDRERHRPTVHPSNSMFKSARSLLLGGGGGGGGGRGPGNDTGYQMVQEQWDDKDVLEFDLDENTHIGMENALRETVIGLGWVLTVVGCCFVCSLGIVAALVMSLPM